MLGAIKALLPTIFKQYWFFTAYVVLYIFSPYINRLLTSLPKKQHLAFVGIMLLFWSIIPTFFTSTSNMYGNQALQFLMLYSIGAYFRMYPENRLNTMRFGAVGTVVCIGLMLLSVAVLDLLGMRFPIFFEICGLFLLPQFNFNGRCGSFPTDFVFQFKNKEKHPYQHGGVQCVWGLFNS